MEFQASVGDCSNPILCRFLNDYTFIYPFGPTSSSTFFWVVLSVSPSLWTHPLLPPPFHPLLPLLSLFKPDSPLLSCQGMERPSTWMTPLPAGLHRSPELSSPAGQTKEFLARACVYLPFSSFLPFSVLYLRNQVPVGPRVLLSMDTKSLNAHSEIVTE